MDVHYDLIYEAGCSPQRNGPISRLNKPREGKPPILVDFRLLQSTIIFYDPKLWDHFRQKHAWTSIKTLSIQSVGHDSQNDPFSRSNESRAGKPQILPIFVCYSLPSFFMIWIFEIILIKNLHRRTLRPYLWSKLVIMA